MAVVVATATTATMAAGAAAEPPGQASGNDAGKRGVGPGGAAEGTPNPRGTTKTVTLVTGDRVDVTTRSAGQQTVVVHPAAGRKGTSFVEQRHQDGRLTVIPGDALPLIAADRLDERLFDVTALIEYGYDDRSRPELPLIVKYAGSAGARSAARQDLSDAGARMVRGLPSAGAAAMRTPKTRAAKLWKELTDTTATATTLQPGIGKVWLDGPARASLDESVPQVGAPAAWRAGFTGDGVKVAVLDSGIDANHPDLADAVVEAQDFTEGGSTQDGFGHGTHVASIVTGNGAASGGQYKGVAPDAGLLVGKVLDDGGYGLESWIIAGMEWAAGSGARVVNMSLGGCATDGTDPLSTALNTLSEQSGAVFVVAAGNHPNNPFCADDDRVSTPAAADRALAVGSVTKQDALSDFSNTGPRVGDGAVKPDLTAPGQSIVAAKAEGTWLGEPVGDQYARMSGTSMAAPHVAGAAAILAEQHPDWNGEQIKAALMASAAPKGDLSVFQQGAGRLDIAAAIKGSVTTTPASLSMGVARWPHTDDQPVTKAFSYHNSSDTAITLDLAISATGPDGTAAPSGMFSLSAETVVVPAGGSAKVSVTADSRVAGPDGRYSGWVTASRASEVVARTPVGFDKEVESYDLTLAVLDRDGNPAPGPVNLVEPAKRSVRTYDLTGEPVTFRLPKGTYDLTSPIWSGEGDLGSLTLAARPEVVLDRDTTVTLDARNGKPIKAIVDSATATPGLRRAYVNNGSFQQGIGTDIDTFGLYATPTKPVTAYPYHFVFQTALAEPESPAAGEDALPRGYNLFLTRDGQIPDPAIRVRDSQLARFRTSLHNQGERTKRVGTMTSFPWPAGADTSWGQRYDVRLPSRRIDLYSAGNGLRWDNELATEQGYELDYYGQAGSTYRPGTTQARDWNTAPLGPVARPIFAYDRLWMTLALFSPGRVPNTFYPATDEGITAQTTLHKNGELVGTNDSVDGGIFAIPAERATYEITTQATRDVPWSALATKVEARWKITAGPNERGNLPIPSLWMSGPVDLLGQAPADEPFPLGVRLLAADQPVTGVASLEVAASFDDGATWKPLKVRPAKDGYEAIVPPAPERGRFVSLRASLRGTDGSEVDQTVIRAYQLAR